MAGDISLFKPPGEEISQFTIFWSKEYHSTQHRPVVEWYAYLLMKKILDDKEKISNTSTRPLPLWIKSEKPYETRFWHNKVDPGYKAALKIAVRGAKIVRALFRLSSAQVSIAEPSTVSLRITPAAANAIVVPPAGATLSDLYTEHKRRLLFHYHPREPERLLTDDPATLEWVVYGIVMEILEQKKKASTGKIEKITYKDSRMLMNAVSTIKFFNKIAEIVRSTFNLSALSPFVWVHANSSSVSLQVEIPKEEAIKLEVSPTIQSFADAYAAKKRQRAAVDLSFFRPSSPKMVLCQDFSEAGKSAAVDWYAFKIMKNILKFMAHHPNQRIPGRSRYTPLHFPTDEVATPTEIADRAIAIAVNSLGLYSLVKTYIWRVAPSRVGIKIPAGGASSPIPPAPSLRNAKSPAERLYEKAVPSPKVFTLAASDGQAVMIHADILEAGARQAFQRFCAAQNSLDRVSFPACSLKLLTILKRSLYLENLEGFTLDSLAEATTLLSVSHDLDLPKLKLWAAFHLARFVTLETFLQVDTTAAQYRLEELIKFLKAKLATDSTLKAQVDDRLCQILGLEGSNLDSIEVTANRYRLEKTLQAIQVLRQPHRPPPEVEKSVLRDKSLFT